MNEVWGEDVLKIKQCRVQFGDRKQMLFAGPRVRMGLYEGVPARVCPHNTTGRADYFGPLVNRSAPRLTVSCHRPLPPFQRASRPSLFRTAGQWLGDACMSRGP